LLEFHIFHHKIADFSGLQVEKSALGDQTTCDQTTYERIVDGG
jgi:hypothetical protein